MKEPKDNGVREFNFKPLPENCKLTMHYKEIGCDNQGDTLSKGEKLYPIRSTFGEGTYKGNDILKHIEMKRYRIKSNKTGYVVQERYWFFFWATKRLFSYPHNYNKFTSLDAARVFVEKLKAVEKRQVKMKKHVEYL